MNEDTQTGVNLAIWQAQKPNVISAIYSHQNRGKIVTLQLCSLNRETVNFMEKKKVKKHDAKTQ